MRNFIIQASVCCALATNTARAQVTRTEQTSGTNALLIAVSAVNDDVVWVSGAKGTWVRTTNGGTTWETGQVPGADSLQFRDVHAIDANTAYVLSIGNGPASRIYKTSDAGKTWTQQFIGTDPKAFYDCFSFWDPRRAVVIGDAIDGQMAVLTTTDGATWQRVPANTLPAAPKDEGSFAASGTCAVTQPGGHAWMVASTADHARLLHTTNYGRSWRIDTVPVTTRSGSGPQSVAFRDPQHGIVFGGGTTAQLGDKTVAFTSDGGATWTLRTSPSLAHGFWGGVYVPRAKQPTLVGVGPSGAVYSTDEGMSWTSIDSMNYWSVGFASPKAGWAVGVGGRITKLSGF